MAIERADAGYQLPRLPQWRPEIVWREQGLWTPSNQTLLEQFRTGTGEARLMRMSSRELDDTLLGWTNRFLQLTGDYVGAYTIQSGHSALRSICVNTREDNRTNDGDHSARSTIKLLADEVPAWEKKAKQLVSEERRSRKDFPQELREMARNIAKQADILEGHDLEEDYDLTKDQLKILLFMNDDHLPGPDPEFVEDVYRGIHALNINVIRPPGGDTTPEDYERYEAAIASVHASYPHLNLVKLKFFYDRPDSMNGDASRHFRERNPDTRARLAKSIRKTAVTLSFVQQHTPELTPMLNRQIRDAREVLFSVPVIAA